MAASPRTLTSDAVAKELGMSAASVARYARSGRIPFSTTPGGHRRFDLVEVRAALSTESRVHLTPLPAATGKVNIAPDEPGFERSEADVRRSAARAVHTGSAATADADAGDLVNLFRQSPKVLVGAATR